MTTNPDQARQSSWTTPVMVVGALFAGYWYSKLEQRLTIAERRVESSDSRLVMVEQNLNSVSQHLSDVERALGGSSAKIVGHLEQVDKRVGRVDKGILVLQTDLSGVEERVGDLENRSSTMEAVIGLPGASGSLGPEPIVESLADTKQLLRSCAVKFPAVPWQQLADEIGPLLDRGDDCSTIANGFVMEGKLGKSQSLEVCSKIYPDFSWFDESSSVEKALVKGASCYDVVMKLVHDGVW